MVGYGSGDYAAELREEYQKQIKQLEKELANLKIINLQLESKLNEITKICLKDKLGEFLK